MKILIGAYPLCDGTFVGGVALGAVRISVERKTDVFLPLETSLFLASGGSGYSIADELTISSGDQQAIIFVTGVGDAGDILTFTVTSNNLTGVRTLDATGGSGSGAAFKVLIIPRTFERVGRVATYSFEVHRAHDDLNDAEQFILDHDSNIPSSGEVTVTNEAASPTSYVIPNGKLTRHELIDQIGKSTVHSYTIVGGQPPAP